jgi:hypothetical protein
MRTFIANFGRENYEWPVCLTRGTIATMNDVRVQSFWETCDRESYIQERMKGMTAAGIAPRRPVASRWFNLMSIISGSPVTFGSIMKRIGFGGTVSRSDPPSFERKIEPIAERRDVIVCHKPCDNWLVNQPSRSAIRRGSASSGISRAPLRAGLSRCASVPRRPAWRPRMSG